MGLSIGALIESAWRPNHFAAGFVETVPSNFGTTGSFADYRRRRFDTILAPDAGADPRTRRYNGLIPIVWRLRVLDDAKLAAVEARSPRQFGAPVSFTPPRPASLLSPGQPNAGSLLK